VGRGVGHDWNGKKADDCGRACLAAAVKAREDEDEQKKQEGVEAVRLAVEEEEQKQGIEEKAKAVRLAANKEEEEFFFLNAHYYSLLNNTMATPTPSW